jgi:hypothetical protein
MLFLFQGHPTTWNFERIFKYGSFNCENELNYLDNHDAVNRTADVLVKAGIGVACA